MSAILSFPSLPDYTPVNAPYSFNLPSSSSSLPVSLLQPLEVGKAKSPLLYLCTTHPSSESSQTLSPRAARSFAVRPTLSLSCLASLSLVPVTDPALLPPYLSHYLWTFPRVTQPHSHMPAIPPFSCSSFKSLICHPPPLPFCCLKDLIFFPLVEENIPI